MTTARFKSSSPQSRGCTHESLSTKTVLLTWRTSGRKPERMLATFCHFSVFHLAFLCPLVVPDPHSATNANIYLLPFSANGTTVNGTILSKSDGPLALKANDHFMIGNREFRFNVGTGLAPMKAAFAPAEADDDTMELPAANSRAARQSLGVALAVRAHTVYQSGSWQWGHACALTRTPSCAYIASTYPGCRRIQVPAFPSNLCKPPPRPVLDLGKQRRHWHGWSTGPAFGTLGGHPAAPQRSHLAPPKCQKAHRIHERGH